MTVFTLQANMTRGELTPLVHGRGDTEHYAAGLALARNVVVTRYGGVTRVPGTSYDGPTKTHAKTSRLLPFEFNRSQVFAIEAGDLYFRFWTPAGRIESAGTPIEVVTPYIEADLKNLRVRQSGDVIYIWCKKTAGGAYQVRTLTRTSDTVWTLALHYTRNGPFLKEDTNGATMTPAETGAIHPDMTSNLTPSGTAANSQSDLDAYNVFDRDPETYNDISGSSGWIWYRQPGSAQVVADAYWVMASDTEAQFSDMPTNFELQGSNNGSTWVTLDSRKGQTNWGNSEKRFYEFPNNTAYEYYRLSFSGGGGDNADPTRIAEIGIHRKASDQTPFNLTLSSAAAINGGSGFLTTDVGRSIRLLGSDGLWRTAEIKTRTSSTVVTVQIDGHSFPDTRPIARWQMGAFSEYTGWPKRGTIYEDRLGHANTDTDPLGMWFSVSADYDNHGVSEPVVDDDAVSLRLTGGKLNDISWMIDQKDVVAGTAGSLRAVGRNNDNAAFSPTNARQKNQTITPSSDAEPVQIEEVVLFLDFFEKRLYEAAYTYEVEGYLAREASTLCEHLFGVGVDQIAYLPVPHKIVVCRRYDGKLIFFTYDREQKVAGASLVDFGGEVESVMSLPGAEGTDLWMITKRTVNGSTVRYVERLAAFWREDFGVQIEPLYGACGGIYNGNNFTTVTGLTHLLNTTVGVWADGRDIGDATISGAGVLTLPGSVSADDVAWGIRMPWEVKTLRLTQIGNQDGSGLGRKVNIVQAHIDMLETQGIEVGSVDVQDLMGFIDESEEDPDAAKPLMTGMHPIAVDDSWRNNGVLVIGGDRMYPATIRAIQLEIDGEP